MSYAVGSLVRARGREWVVLPDSTPEMLLLRPLGGTEREVAGLYLPLEGDAVRAATFALPDPTQPGDFRASRLLRDAVRLGFRSSAGPFRSFARMNVEPRPYQLVPLLMALRMEPVRLLIADDIGIGKTVEAGLIARELLDRGEVQRLAVLCPPHLAEQWQSELRSKFHIEAELVLSSTVNRLERQTAVGQSLFDLYPYVVISTEYIKSTRRREEFVRSCPELVIVDEAHTCAFSIEARGGRHLRHQLLRALAADPKRHLVLVTATPHSGNEGAFRSLLGLLKPEFLDLPDDLTGRLHEAQRRRVAEHLIQRRRADVRAYMEASTFFPTRNEREEAYTLTQDYRRFLNSVLDYARERIGSSASATTRHQRVQWWSVLALLRSLASSPAAAAATLRSRSVTVESESAEEADLLGERAVLDLDDSDSGEALDGAPGAQNELVGEGAQRERLLRLARMADSLHGPKKDEKLRRAIELVKELLADGFNPILFCRFIPTAEYVAQALRDALPKGVEVVAITGLLPPTEREQRVHQMEAHERRVLVATDCLSEGINLQDAFNAVVHYDLSWNPTRHEQREGRVDRYGQPSESVRTLTYYGVDNQIDGLVLDVLIRKHRAIRNSLGISVPVPARTSEVIEALMNGLLLRDSRADAKQLALDLGTDLYVTMHSEWDNATEREKRSRTLFAQGRLDVSEVAREWEAVQEAIGSSADVRRFIEEVVRASGGFVSERGGTMELQLPNRAALREAAGNHERLRARFELPVPTGTLHLTRTHPIVEGLASHVMDTALDPLVEGIARRCGVVRTEAVQQRTTLLLLRFRYHILSQRGPEEKALLAEDSQIVAFRGAPAAAEWLPEAEAEALLEATPSANIHAHQATDFLRSAIEGFGDLRGPLNEIARRRGAALLDAHRRVRGAARLTGVRYDIRPHLPPDVLGLYVLLPHTPTPIQRPD